MTAKIRPPSAQAEQFVIRFPPGMRDRIAEEAKLNQRSMNAEIVNRLETTLSAKQSSAGLSVIPHHDGAAPSLVLPSGILGTSFLSKLSCYGYNYGSDMAPDICDGDIVIFDRMMPRDGCIAGVKIDSDLALCRAAVAGDVVTLHRDQGGKPISMSFSELRSSFGALSYVGMVICIIGKRG